MIQMQWFPMIEITFNDFIQWFNNTFNDFRWLKLPFEFNDWNYLGDNFSGEHQLSLSGALSLRSDVKSSNKDSLFIAFCILRLIDFWISLSLLLRADLLARRRRGNRSKGCKELYLKAQAGIWPWLSYMCQIPLLLDCRSGSLLNTQGLGAQLAL